MVLRGLRRYPVALAAVCSASDSGGSTGLIRDEFGDALPSGDIRRCLAALSQNDEMCELLEHRFEGDGSTTPRITNHNLGNLILLAAEQRWGAVAGIDAVGKILQINGRVLPVTTDIVHLIGELSDGTMLRGEGRIDTRDVGDERTLKKVWLEPKAFICREAAEVIINADMIVIGPGDLYTSLVPNLLVEGMADALAQSKARIVYVVNLMTKWAETRDYTAADFAETLLKYGIGHNKLDTVLVNYAKIPDAILDFYSKTEKATPIDVGEKTLARLRKLAHTVVYEDVLSTVGLQHNLIRHDPEKVGHCIMKILGEGK